MAAKVSLINREEADRLSNIYGSEVSMRNIPPDSLAQIVAFVHSAELDDEASRVRSACRGLLNMRKRPKVANQDILHAFDIETFISRAEGLERTYENSKIQNPRETIQEFFRMMSENRNGLATLKRLLVERAINWERITNTDMGMTYNDNIASTAAYKIMHGKRFDISTEGYTLYIRFENQGLMPINENLLLDIIWYFLRNNMPASEVSSSGTPPPPPENPPFDPKNYEHLMRLWRILGEQRALLNRIRQGLSGGDDDCEPATDERIRQRS